MAQQLEQSPLQVREGSPWTGLWAVVTKDMADHLTSMRMRILDLLIIITAGVTVFGAIQNLQTNVAGERFLFLQLFTTAQEPLPAFVGFLSFLVPLIAIALAFDAVNGEFNRRTLSRILAQPIYRDALLFGKFLAGLLTLTLVLAAIWLLIIGLGIVRLGVPPSGEEVARSFLFLVATVFYGGIWLALGMVFSTIFRQPATAALGSIAVWLFFTIFWNIIAQVGATILSPSQTGNLQDAISQAETAIFLSRLSPNTLYIEATVGLLVPNTRSFGFVFPTQLEGAIDAPLPLLQSVLLIWPQMTGLIAATLLLFTMAYVLFQRQEIRA